jgi:hypothetical protein
MAVAGTIPVDPGAGAGIVGVVVGVCATADDAARSVVRQAPIEAR